MSVIIAPSILSADFTHLGVDIALINRSEAEWIHIDVMDGMFVPNISFGFPVLKAVRHSTELFCDVHLMIAQPERYIAEFKAAGADNITVHIEACTHLDATLRAIRAMNISCGVALNPATPIALLHDVITIVDVVLVMSVNPGFGGQPFLPNTLRKIKATRQLIVESGSQARIQVDGGVGPLNAADVIAAGAEILVAGNSVFGAPDLIEAIHHLKALGTK